jgi:putative nucleotidyltransferase with HDIG domain
MNFTAAKQTFQTYLTGYDHTDDKVRLKIVHTYGVVRQAEAIAGRMHLPEEDKQLAQMIALLHDIGRFEQLKRFHSFEPNTMDHAAYGVHVLFEEGMIRQFIEEDTWDTIIRTAIAKHSDYRLEGITDQRTLLHAKLIRDADKLDNCRVKLEDDTYTLLGASAEEIGAQDISPAIYDTVFRNQCILSADRVTAMDYWVSYVAYFFDLNFRESLDIVAEHNYVSRIVRRIPYSNPKTKEQMQEIEDYINRYVSLNRSK